MPYSVVTGRTQTKVFSPWVLFDRFVCQVSWLLFRPELCSWALQRAASTTMTGKEINQTIKTRVKKERKWSFIYAFCSRPCPATLSAGRGPSFTNGWQKSTTVKCHENAGHLTQANMATNDHRLVPIFKRYLSFKLRSPKSKTSQ